MRRLLSVLALLSLLLGALAHPAQAAGEEKTYLISFQTGTSAQATGEALLPARTRAGAQILTRVTQGAIARLTASEAATLAKNPRVAQVLPDQVVAAADLTQSPAPWHLDRLDGRETWRNATYTTSNGGENVTVYVVDSGIDRTHSEFARMRLKEGADLVAGATNPDCHWHGTAVSSMVGGATLGAAKNAVVVPVRALGCDQKGTAAAVWSAVEWILANHASGTPGVVNLSLTAPGSHLSTPVQSLVNHGLVVVAAAGNDARDACQNTPASAPDAITVAATDINDQEASWSNYGRCVDLYAPGDGVTVAMPSADGGTTAFGTAHGTSYAAPLVSGAAAIVLSEHPGWTPSQVWEDLRLRAAGGLVSGARSPNLLLSVAGLGTLTGGQPQITGSASIGSQLSASLRWEPPATGSDYQWYRAGEPIPGATGPHYTTVAADLNQPLTVSVTGRRQGYAPVTGRSQPFTPTTAAVPGTYRALAPARVLDTRSGTGHRGRLAGGAVLSLPVAGRGGVPAGASAVVLNLTVTAPAAPGYVSAGTGNGSNLNFSAGQTVSNLAVVPLGADGSVAIRYASVGSGDLVADVQGYVVGGSAEQPGTVRLTSPTRLVDTRQTAAVPSGGELRLRLAGQAGLPQQVGAAVLNVTVVDPGAAGYLTVFPDGQPPPTASNLNFVAGQTVPNLVLVKNGTDGIVIRNGAAAPVQVVADLQAYVLPGQASASGAVVAMAPVRVLDTRTSGGALQPRQTRTVAVRQQAGVPVAAQAAVLNATVVAPTAAGFLTVYPAGSAQPTVSNVNVTSPGVSVPNLAFATLGDGSASLYWGSGGSTHVVADVSGYVLP